MKVVDKKLGLSEVRKDRAIQEFARSACFDAARRSVRALAAIGAFSRQQMDRILTAAIANDQVRNAWRVSESLDALVARNDASPEVRERFMREYHP